MDFLVKKWKHAFNTFFDINHSATLEWADFELLIQKIKDQRGPASEDYKHAESAMKGIWNSLVSVADENKDNKVSLEEWLHMWTAVHTQKHFPDWQSAYLTYMFKLLDSSGDNLIDNTEYKTVLSMYGIPEAEADSAFAHVSVIDGKKVDGIDFGAFSKLWNDFFMSTDPNAPGNFLFGNVK